MACCPRKATSRGLALLGSTMGVKLQVARSRPGQTGRTDFSTTQKVGRIVAHVPNSTHVLATLPQCMPGTTVVTSSLACPLLPSHSTFSLAPLPRPLPPCRPRGITLSSIGSTPVLSLALRATEDVDTLLHPFCAPTR